MGKVVKKIWQGAEKRLEKENLQERRKGEKCKSDKMNKQKLQ